jgi:tripartite-type tricarboxylate transporter receptor subunit TctC
LNTAPLLAVLLATFILAHPLPAQAQSYPSKPIRVVVPFPPSTGVDITTRLFAPDMSEALGQQIVVDNRAGAASTIGAAVVARAAPDGYTLLAASASTASAQSLVKDLPYQLGDLAPVALLASSPFLLVIHPSLPAKNVKELVAIAKARPGQMSFASAGIGSSPHLTGELFKMQARIDMLHVPYKGNPQALSDLIGGQVSMTFVNPLSAMPHVKSGRVRAIASTSEKRSAVAPDLPTIAESGLPGFESGTWFALMAPAGTPRDIVTRLNATAAKVAARKEVRERLMANGAEPQGGTPEQVGAFVRTEIAKWSKVIAAARVQPE